MGSNRRQAPLGETTKGRRADPAGNAASTRSRVSPPPSPRTSRPCDGRRLRKYGPASAWVGALRLCRRAPHARRRRRRDGGGPQESNLKSRGAATSKDGGRDAPQAPGILRVRSLCAVRTRPGAPGSIVQRWVRSPHARASAAGATRPSGRGRHAHGRHQSRPASRAPAARLAAELARRQSAAFRRCDATTQSPVFPRASTSSGDRVLVDGLDGRGPLVARPPGVSAGSRQRGRG